MQIKTNTQHLLERANRVLSTSKFSDRPTTLTTQELDRWVTTIQDNCPEDWRFSDNPEGEFLLTVIRNDSQLKFLGRSSRATRIWKQLYAGAKKAAEATESEPDKKVIERLARLYLREQSRFDSEIFHELKTVFTGRMIPSSAKRYGAGMDEAHMSILNGSEADKNLARRPNAILIDQDGCEPQLLVRQGQPYLRAFPGAAKSVSHCIFARLGKNGIISGTGQLWKISGGGVAYEQGMAECWPSPKPDPADLPGGFRTYSYWQVPLKLDVLRNDLSFRVSKAKHSQHSEVSKLLCVVELIQEKARDISRTDGNPAEAAGPSTASTVGHSSVPSF
ncbi:MAG: hypothetical protein AAF491_05170 [Verrucomicrobiota bacterium]